MHLGPERTAAFIRQVLDAGSYVVCHVHLSSRLSATCLSGSQHEDFARMRWM
jgi:hypothetical protein